MGKVYKMAIKRAPKKTSAVATQKRHLEDDEQMLFFAWFDSVFPHLQKLCRHVPNGGKRDAREGARFKRLGVRAGALDIELNIARHGFHGLFIEMKTGKNKPTQHQFETIQALREQGYACHVCYSAESAKQTVIKYLAN